MDGPASPIPAERLTHGLLPAYRHWSGSRSHGPSEGMMREAIVGFDSAWGDRVPGAAAWATLADGRFEAFGPPRTVHFDGAAQIVAERRINADYVLVAMDQPSLVPNEKGMRPVERVAASLVSGLGGGVQPANRRKAPLFGAAAPVWRFLDRLGARQNPPIARTATDGLHLIEVFPALALPALCPGNSSA